jgi:hypothetical protein
MEIIFLRPRPNNPNRSWENTVHALRPSFGASVNFSIKVNYLARSMNTGICSAGTTYHNIPIGNFTYRGFKILLDGFLLRKFLFLPTGVRRTIVFDAKRYAVTTRSGFFRSWHGSGRRSFLCKQAQDN